MQGYDPDNGLKIEKRDQNKAFKDVLAKRDIEWIYLMVFIKTKRLILRQWEESDLAPFAALNADPRVREFFPSILSREESDQEAKLCSDQIANHGWGFWAVSLIETQEFIGLIGLKNVHFAAHFTPAVEIGWRLAYDHWGKGYAQEGARAALAYGFETLRLDQIVSFTTLNNIRSRAVMEKIGMSHQSLDAFDHPRLPEGHPLKKHVLYRLHSHDWFESTYKNQKYVFKPYSKTFPDLFKKEKDRISSFLKHASIEHVGSTAVPDLGGKGIIDIAICVPEKEMELTTEILKKIGYQYKPAYSTPERLFLIAYLPDSEEKTRVYHIHLTHPASMEYKGLIDFRDYLKNHPKAAQEYASLKKNAANIANQEGKHYRKIKEPMFKKIKEQLEKSF